MTKVLFIDDEPDIWAVRLERSLRKSGLVLVVEANPTLALQRIASDSPDVVLLDSLFRNRSGRLVAKGSELLSLIHEKYPTIPVVIFTATLENDADESDFPNAVALFGKQMFDSDEGDPDAELAAILVDAVRKCADNRSLDERLGFVVGDTQAMRKAAVDILSIAPLTTTVLIHGETGAGKELAVRALHRESGRSGPLVAIDCGVLDGPTLESQLFGHERGAFTDAARAHDGLFQQANGGTLFLDEMPAMSPALQDKIVRAVETKYIRRMGGSSEISVDVRVIAASNQSLSDLMSQGRFRHDLYQRLSALEIYLPPLRERRPDLAAFFRTLVAKLNLELGKRISTEPRGDVLAKLATYSWPGNVRELEKVLRTAMMSARANMLTPSTIRLPEGPKSTLVDSSSDPLDLAERILAGKAGWDEFKEIQGGARRAILVKLWATLARKDGREPGSKDLAALFGTTDDNVRQMLKKQGGISSLKTADACRDSSHL